jgi:hypothetical protein
MLKYEKRIGQLTKWIEEDKEELKQSEIELQDWKQYPELVLSITTRQEFIKENIAIYERQIEAMLKELDI